jgi:N-sulfoglucosamine sulfohydrolase
MAGESAVTRRAVLRGCGTAACMRRSSAAFAPSLRPNILFCLADNFSWPHPSCYGNQTIDTPNIDRAAREGVRFTNAYCCAPSCAPSRGGMLTGQAPWRLEEGANLWGTLPARFPVFPDLLEQAGYEVGFTGKHVTRRPALRPPQEQAGYEVGFTGKGYSPALLEAGGRKRSPCGPAHRGFHDFLKAKPAGKPFCFWFGGFDTGQGGKPEVTPPARMDHFKVPPFLPDTELVRRDFVRHFKGLQRFDFALGEQISLLETAGLLENTLVVIAADNGMEFPRCYPNLYDYGTREFLIARWGGGFKGSRVVNDFVTFTDLAPTFLEAAGLRPTPEMTGRSLMGILGSGKSGQVDPGRNFAVTARERHDWCRAGGVGYPGRAIRTREFLYIRNYHPDRWPAGDPDRETFREGIYGDVDRSDTKWYMIEHRDDPAVRPLFELSFGKRPGEELYDLNKDPDQMKNVAARPEYARVRRELAARLDAYLKQTGDPRALGKKALWDEYPYYGPKRFEK